MMLQLHAAIALEPKAAICYQTIIQPWWDLMDTLHVAEVVTDCERLCYLLRPFDEKDRQHKEMKAVD